MIISDILTSLLNALGISNLFRKRPYCIWIYETTPTGQAVWTCLNPQGNSYNRCKEAIKALTEANFPLRRYVILPKNVKPY